MYPGECPSRYESVDYRLNDNPYLAKFGENEWENRIRKCPLLRNSLPVSDLIIHMAKSTTDAMKGTIHEGHGLFFHDALSQLTEKATVTWMKNNKYEDRTYHSMWITPVLGCNDLIQGENGKTVTCYAHRPVGNMPEAMCLDNALNQDMHMAVDGNVGATYFLPDSDPRKFSLTTPNRIVSAYKRVHCPTTEHSAIPSSRRIKQDVSKVIFALKCIVDAEGNVVRGLASREGHHRWVEYCRNNRSMNGSYKDDGDNEGNGDSGGNEDNGKNGQWLHHDAKCALEEYWKADGQQVATLEA